MNIVHTICRYYPTRNDLRNLVTKAKMAIRFSAIDQENVEKLLERIEYGASTFYRPCMSDVTVPNTTTQGDSDSDTDDESLCVQDCSTNGEKLLFVYQVWELDNRMHYFHSFSPPMLTREVLHCTDAPINVGSHIDRCSLCRTYPSPQEQGCKWD